MKEPIVDNSVKLCYYFFMPLEDLRFRFAPGVAEQILADKKQRAKAEQEGYKFRLGDMDLAQAAVAKEALYGSGIDYAYPAGYLAFKTPEERLSAIEIIYVKESQRLGWKWRVEKDPRPKSSMTTEEWVAWMGTQPIAEQYLKDTSKDPNKPQTS